jgi:hypothetical protein
VFTIDVPDEIVLLELTPQPNVIAPPAVDPPPPPPAVDPTDACDGVPSSVFTDVPAAHRFAAEINCLAAWEVTRGVGSGRRFEPQRPLQRWQMAVFMARVAGLQPNGMPDGHNTASTFDDIGSLSAEARQAIARMQRLDVIKGTTRRSFAPFRHVTRGEIAAFLNRLLKVDGDAISGAPNYFTDDDASTHEADINALAAAGIARGVGGGRYRPGAAVTRGEMAAMLTRYIHNRVAAGRLDIDARG